MKYIVALTLSILLFPASILKAQESAKNNNVDRYSELAKNIEIFTSLYRELNSYYVDDVDPNKVMLDAINGMLEELDPYTEYISAADIDEYQFQTTGKYGGIGATISEKEGMVIIRSPYEGSPAQKAGLMAGDQIIEVDGLSADKKNSEEIRQLLRGQPNTNLTIKVKRAITGQVLTFTFAREEINVGNVPFSGMLNNGIGYIRLDQFTENAGVNVANALKELKEKGELKGLILDLRGNPGGLLNEAVAVSNVFIDKGNEVVETRGKVKEANNKYTTPAKAIDLNIPLAVLINRGSASASEIVSGVIQDFDRGIILGQTTFGKGLVQITRPLPYKGKLKVTTYKYYIPSGRCIQAIDYSAARNEDGDAPSIPDSLRKTFYTKAGRIVKDGAGIEPDITLSVQSYAPITISLITKDLIFDYATIYRSKHSQLTNLDPQTFALTDAEYEEFIKFIEDKDYDYTTKTEKMLYDLISTAKNESYYDGISDALKVLEGNMKHDKNQDLIKHKEEIKSLLESEIASRYGYQKARIQVELKYDDEVRKAIEVLESSNQYKSILTVKK